MTTMLGLYHNGVAGNDYPNVEGWPVGYVPIPIHTLPFGGDPVKLKEAVDKMKN
jgi:hypothetical protein